MKREEPPEDRLFSAALALAREEREAFVERAAGGDAELLANVRMLLEAYELEGGDDVGATLLDEPRAREQWAEEVEEPGTRIGHFTLIRKLGEGGMGAVWEAEQTGSFERTVALKVIKLGMDTLEVVARFERERQTLARMKHENIAQVFEAGATSMGRPYFVMELVEGVQIAEFCERRALGLRERVGLFILKT